MQARPAQKASALDAQPQSLSRQLVRLMQRKFQEGIPADVAMKSRLHIADAIGIGLAARRDTDLADEPSPFADGPGICTVLGRGSKGTPATAAFVNSSLIHSLDFDDIHDAARLHPTAVTFPAALAAAELSQAGTDALQTAVALGSEMMCRMGLMWKPIGTGPGSDWFLSQLLGYFGASLSAGLLLGLTEDELVSAMGLAYMQAAGGKEAGFGVGSNARAIYPAFAAMGGINATLLARRGIMGPERAFEGSAGLFHIYFGQQPNSEALDLLFDEDAWQFLDTHVKPWPCCRISQPYVAAAQAIREQIKSPIRSVVALVNASSAKLCRPLPARRQPITIGDAKYSIPFMTAFALVHGRVNLHALNAKSLHDARTLEVAAKVDIDESLPDGPGQPPAVIIVKTDQGELRSPVGVAPVFDAPQLHNKFDACLEYAGRSQGAGALWEFLMRTDNPPVNDMPI